MAYPLRSCVWEITLGCSFACKYCGSSGGKARFNELTTDECLSICNQLAHLGCQRVSLIGGEVFMRADWHIITKRLTKLGIKVIIITNGYWMNDDLIQKIQETGVESIAVSIDGCQEIHDAYRQKGSYDRAITAVNVLTQQNIRVSVITTLHKENVKDLESLYQNLCAYPIFAWQLQACSPMGNAARGGIDINFDVKEVISFVEEHMYTAPFMMGLGDNIGYYNENEGRLRGIRNGNYPFMGCRAGLTNIGIDSVGNVKGCESLYDPRFIEGNLRHESLSQIWNDPNRFAYNRAFTLDQLTGQCATCKDGYRCAGGCRSYNYFTHGKLYEAKRCVKTQTDIT